MAHSPGINTVQGLSCDVVGGLSDSKLALALSGCCLCRLQARSLAVMTMK